MLQSSLQRIQSSPPWYWSSGYGPNECCEKRSCYKMYLKNQPFPLHYSWWTDWWYCERCLQPLPSAPLPTFPCALEAASMGSQLKWRRSGGYVMQWEHVSARAVRLLTLPQFRCKAKYSHNITKQTAETVGLKDKYLPSYRILSEGMCSCCLVVGLSRNWRYIGSEIQVSFSMELCFHPQCLTFETTAHMLSCSLTPNHFISLP